MLSDRATRSLSDCFQIYLPTWLRVVMIIFGIVFMMTTLITIWYIATDDQQYSEQHLEYDDGNNPLSSPCYTTHCYTTPCYPTPISTSTVRTTRPISTSTVRTTRPISTSTFRTKTPTSLKTTPINCRKLCKILCKQKPWLGGKLCNCDSFPLCPE